MSPQVQSKTWFDYLGTVGPGDGKEGLGRGSVGPGDGGEGLGGRGSVGPDKGWGDWFFSMALAMGLRRKIADTTINSIILRFIIAPYPTARPPEYDFSTEFSTTTTFFGERSAQRGMKGVRFTDRGHLQSELVPAVTFNFNR